MLVALGGQNVRFQVVLLQTRPSFARPREDDGSAVPHQGQRHADDTMVQEGECIRGSRRAGREVRAIPTMTKTTDVRRDRHEAGP
jgi:hypothetical protein